MIRRYILFGLVTLLFSFSSYAQYKQTGGFARLLGMGGNPYVVDPYVMTVNPGWGGYYPNFLWGDLGGGTGFGPGGTGQFAGVNFHLGRGFTLGGMLTRNDFNGLSIAKLDPGVLVYTGGGDLTLVSLTSLVPNVVPLNNNLELMGAYKTGNTSIGLGVAYASTTAEATPSAGGTSSASASQIGVNAGIVTKLSGNFMLDLGASLLLPSATFEPATGSATEFSQTYILANARFFYNYSAKLAFVPTIIFVTSSGTADIGGATTTSTDLTSMTLIAFGVGINYEVGDFLLAGGPSFATTSLTIPENTGQWPELSQSVLSFPMWNLGAEWNMNEWFVARLGYVASTHKATADIEESGTEAGEFITTLFGPSGATVGVGFRLGNFSLDATVNEGVLRQGLNNIGGGGPTFAYLSASLSMP